MSKNFLSSIILISFLAGFLLGCQPQQPAKLDPVVLQLNFTNSSQFAGYYVAVEKGYYVAEGLDVQIKEKKDGKPDIPATMRDGSADFAVFSPIDQQNTPEAVIVAAMFQISPRTLFALAASGIRTPLDLAGKKVANKSKGWGVTVNSVLSNAGMDPAVIVNVPVGSNEQNKLYDGTVDVWTGFVTDEVVQARMSGHAVNVIYAADYAVGAYENMLGVRADLLKSNPGLVERFVRATLRGWQEAVAQIDYTAEVLTKWQSGQDKVYYREAWLATVPLVDTGQVPIGWIDESRWKREAEAAGKVYDPSHPGFTTQFIANP
jgi:ABC-type nitrate/sulfonate/bicarbonate transport system substrate-binding protein